MNRGAWWTPVHRVTRSQTQLSDSAQRTSEAWASVMSSPGQTRGGLQTMLKRVGLTEDAVRSLGTLQAKQDLCLF